MNRTGHRRPRRAQATRARTAALIALSVVLAAGTSPAADPAPLAGEASAGGRAGPARRGRQCVVAFRALGEVPGSDTWGLASPRALSVNHRGDIVIADTGNHRVIAVTRSGGIVQEFGGFGWEDGQFDTPSDVAVDQGFYVYVLDEGNRRVQRFDAEGDFVDLVVDEDEAGSPVSLAVGQAGEILLVDADSQSVVKRSQFSEALAPIGRFGSGEGGLTRPRSVAWGPSREVAVSDPGRGAVEVFDEFGSGLYSLSCPDTLDPGDLIFDSSGSLIVADLRHGRVVAFPPGGGPASAAFGGEGIPFRPSALAIDREGLLAVLDGEGGRIVLIEMVHGTCPSDR